MNVEGDGSLLLQYAVCLPTTKITLNMIQRGTNVNKQNAYGMSALHRAVRENNLQQVQLLLEYGADVSLKPQSGDTPLHCNSMNYKCGPEEWDGPSYYIFKLLLDKGASCNEQNARGISVFFAAAWLGNLAIVKLLLSYGADVRAANSDGQTALHFAARNENADVIECIILHGVDIDYVEEHGHTALHRSVFTDNYKMCEILLQYGAVFDSARSLEDETQAPLWLI